MAVGAMDISKSGGESNDPVGAVLYVRPEVCEAYRHATEGRFYHLIMYQHGSGGDGYQQIRW